jgi:hypothetical protein
MAGRPPTAPNSQDTIRSASESTEPLDARPTRNEPILRHFRHQLDPFDSYPRCIQKLHRE